MAPPTPLIIDTDPGVDDVLAILLALASSEVSVKAITLTFGNTTLDYAHSNILRTAAVLQEHLASETTSEGVKQRLGAFSPDAEKIILASGAEKPLGGRMFTAGYFHGRDGLSGLHSLPDDPFAAPASAPAPLVETEKSAADVMLDILREHEPGTVRIAALGPLTNLAIAFEEDPETFARIGGISVMGGALDVPGNTSPVAEFNFFADPWAVKHLFETAPAHPVMRGKRLPIDLIPLDITSDHVVPYSKLVKEAEAQVNRLEAFISTFLKHPRLVTNSLVNEKDFDPEMHDLFQAHDPLAIAHAIFVPVGGEAEGWQHRIRQFRIETEGEHTRGFCVVDRRNRSDDLKGRNSAEDDPNAHLQENGATPAVKRQKTNANGVASAESEVGVVNVLTKTPGIEWFAQLFLDRLGL